MTNWEKMRECANYNLPSIQALKRRKSKRDKKAAKLNTAKIIRGFQADLKDRKTPAESQFEQFLNTYKIKYEFQKVIRSQKQHYIVDFYLPEYHAVIEIDGQYHDDPDQKIKDKSRSANLRRNKIVARIIRFNNQDINKQEFITLFISKLCPFVGAKLLVDSTTNRYLTPGTDKSINFEGDKPAAGLLRIVK